MRPCYLNFPFNIYLLQHHRPIPLSLSLSLLTFLRTIEYSSTFQLFSCEKDFPKKKEQACHTNLNCLISCDKKPFLCPYLEGFAVNIYFQILRIGPCVVQQKILIIQWLINLLVPKIPFCLIKKFINKKKWTFINIFSQFFNEIRQFNITKNIMK